MVLWSMGAVHKVCHAIFDDFLPPRASCHKLSQILDPLIVCQAFEQKVNKKQISERVPLNIYNCYYIQKNNKIPYNILKMFLINPAWKTQDLLINFKHEGVHFDPLISFLISRLRFT